MNRFERMVEVVLDHERRLGYWQAKYDCGDKGCMYCKEWLKTNEIPPLLVVR